MLLHSNKPLWCSPAQRHKVVSSLMVKWHIKLKSWGHLPGPGFATQWAIRGSDYTVKRFKCAHSFRERWAQAHPRVQGFTSSHVYINKCILTPPTRPLFFCLSMQKSAHFFPSFGLKKSRNWKRRYARRLSICRGSLLSLRLNKINNKSTPEMVSPWKLFRFTWREAFSSWRSAATFF